MQHIIRPSQDVEHWIHEGWEMLNDHEKNEVEERIHTLFQDGLPFTLEHDKVIYLYIFTLLSQLEVIALQLPIRALPALKNKAQRKMMRQQLVDEVFHAMLFTKIAYELATPYNYLPKHNHCIDNIRSIIRDEKDLGTAIVLLNIIAESWFEELLITLNEKNIAPKVVLTVLEDEQRHVKEAELYKAIGLPSKKYLEEKIKNLEAELLGDLLFQHEYSQAMAHALGAKGCRTLMQRIHATHTRQLKSLDIQPHEKWELHINTFMTFIGKPENDFKEDSLQTPSITRQALMTAWDTPVDPTMFAMFSLNVSRLETFENKYPPQTLTGLMLQAMAKISKENHTLRHYVSHNKMYNMEENHIHLVISLPGEKNHLALLKLKDVHEASLEHLSEAVQNYVEVMSYARYQADILLKEHPRLLTDFYKDVLPDPNNIFQDIYMPQAMITLTNVGPWGGEQCLSPLLPNEVLKLTMSQVERKQVWNNKIKSFEIQDRLPIGLSADHRAFDGNMGTPKMLQIALDEMIDRLEGNIDQPTAKIFKPASMEKYIEITNKMMEENYVLAYRYFTASSHCWSSEVDLDLLYEKVFSVVKDELLTE